MASRAASFFALAAGAGTAFSGSTHTTHRTTQGASGPTELSPPELEPGTERREGASDSATTNASISVSVSASSCASSPPPARARAGQKRLPGGAAEPSLAPYSKSFCRLHALPGRTEQAAQRSHGPEAQRLRLVREKRWRERETTASMTSQFSSSAGSFLGGTLRLEH